MTTERPGRPGRPPRGAPARRRARRVAVGRARPGARHLLGSPRPQQGGRHPQEATDEAAVITVNVVNPKPGDPVRDIRCPVSPRPSSTRRSSRATSGYLKRWYFDIGARGEAGPAAGRDHSPEVDQQLPAGARRTWRPRRPISARPRSPRTAGRPAGQRLGVQAGDGCGVSALSAMKATADSTRERPGGSSSCRLREDLRPVRRDRHAGTPHIGALIDAGSATATGSSSTCAIQRLRVFSSRSGDLLSGRAHRRVSGPDPRRVPDGVPRHARAQCSAIDPRLDPARRGGRRQYQRTSYCRGPTCSST